jgi:hypothetical protein
VINVDTTSSKSGVVFKWDDWVTSTGTFSPFASNQVVLAPLTPNGKMDSTIIIKDIKLGKSGCHPENAKWKGLIASGTAIVQGQYENAKKTSPVTFTFDNPKMIQTVSFFIPCKDKPLQNTFPPNNFTGITGIHETFPNEGGSKVIKIPALDKGLEIINKSPDNHIEYKATLDIEKVQ